MTNDLKYFSDKQLLIDPVINLETANTMRASIISTATKNKQQDQPANIQLLCFDLNNCKRSTQFLLLTAATFLFYLLYGYMQELMYKLEGFGKYAWYLTLIQFLFYTCFGYVETRIRNNLERKIPLKTYLLLAFLTVATMGLSNASVAHLNYPTQVMFKCCKLIPVMIGGILIQGKRYNIYDVSACISMSVGLIFFTLADSQVQPDFKILGVILVSGALIADAIIGNVQEKQMKLHKASNYEVVLYSYGIGFFYVLIGELLFDVPAEAFVFWLNNPIKTYGYAFIFSLTGYLGINVVLDLVKNFGALLAVTVTTCRKAVTMALSFLFFTKPFTFQYLWSGLIVLLGIYLNLFSKNRDKWEPVAYSYYVRIFGTKKKTSNTNAYTESV